MFTFGIGGPFDLNFYCFLLVPQILHPPYSQKPWGAAALAVHSALHLVLHVALLSPDLPSEARFGTYVHHPCRSFISNRKYCFLKQLPFISLPDTILDLLLMYAKIYHLNALAERGEKFLSFLAITCTRNVPFSPSCPVTPAEQYL